MHSVKMPRRSYKVVGICVAVLAVWGCEKTVQVDIPQHDAQIVVNSFFSQDSVWTVDLSQSQSVTNPQPFQLINDANVELWANGIFQENLTGLGTGRYVSVHSTPEADVEYTLKVDASRFASVEATAALPEPMDLVSVGVVPGSVSQSSIGENSFQVEVRFEDAPNVDNFYELIIFQRFAFGEGADIEYTEYFEAFFESGDPSLDSDDFFESGEPGFNRAYFSDALFDGETKSLKVKLFVFGNTNITQDLVVSLASTTEDYYRYRRSVELQEFLGEDPFSEPVPIHSNMSNGFGIFTGYMPTRTSLSVEL